MMNFAFGLACGLVAGFVWGLYKHSFGFNDGYAAAVKHFTEHRQ